MCFSQFFSCVSAGTVGWGLLLSSLSLLGCGTLCQLHLSDTAAEKTAKDTVSTSFYLLLHVDHRPPFEEACCAVRPSLLNTFLAMNHLFYGWSVTFPQISQNFSLPSFCSWKSKESWAGHLQQRPAVVSKFDVSLRRSTRKRLFVWVIDPQRLRPCLSGGPSSAAKLGDIPLHQSPAEGHHGWDKGSSSDPSSDRTQA